MSDAQPSDDERAARLAAQRQAWNEAHPTYYAEYRERNREDIRRKNRERERDRAQREREEKARRQKGIDRAKAWAREHPEQRQQARERYKQKHPRRRTSRLSATTIIAIATRSLSAGGHVRQLTRRRRTRRDAARSTVPGLRAAPLHGRPLLTNARRIVSGRTKHGACSVAARVPDCPSDSFTGFTRRSDVTTMPRRTPSSRRSGPVRTSPESEIRTSRPLRIWCTRGRSGRRTDVSCARSSRSPRSTSPIMRSSCGRGSPMYPACASGAGCCPSTYTLSHAVTLSSSQAEAISAPTPPPRHHR